MTDPRERSRLVVRQLLARSIRETFIHPTTPEEWSRIRAKLARSQAPRKRARSQVLAELSATLERLEADLGEVRALLERIAGDT